MPGLESRRGGACVREVSPSVPPHVNAGIGWSGQVIARHELGTTDTIPPMTRSATPRERRRFATLATILGVTLLSLIAACTSTVVPSGTPTPSTPTSSGSASASAPASGSPSPAGTPAASPSSAGADCTVADLTIRGGPWGGAAGSRGADVTVTAGATACRLPAHPVVAMLDSTGRELVHSTLPVTNDGPILDAGASRAFSFLVGNWCDRTARLPLQAVGLVADGPIEIGGLVMNAEDLPPCNGPGQPATVTTTDWQ